MGLKIENKIDQSYDGAATMSVTKGGVTTHIKRLNRKILYTHCYGHALNLAVNDCIRKVEVLKDSWVMMEEVCNLVKKSPSRETKLKEICETA